LARRARRPGLHSAAAAADQLSELARRGVTSFMERRVLLDESSSPWLMGHGSPAPLELVGTGFTDLVIRSIRLVRRLAGHGRFVFVGSEQAQRGEMTLGQALRPCEYAVIGTLEMHLREALDAWRPRHATTEDLAWHPGEERMQPREWMARFREEVCPEIVYGVYRATDIAPPHLFFAHRAHVHTAARVAIADSRFDDRRGFPMLIDLADRVCRSVYAGGSLREMCETAYARAGAPFRYRSERATRDR
ncbi:MAG: hypothetical protein K2W96_28050, partial [Gemmataceae bacterium]|nr:hypothetical protein [Gemmataceae bacterium]